MLHSIFLTVTKVLTTASEDHTVSIIVDLDVTNEKAEDLQCMNWADHPLRSDGTAGGLIVNTPVICGGEYFNECFSIKQRNTEVYAYISVKRWDSAGIVLNDSVLWISGGEQNKLAWGMLDTSEYITHNSSSPGPNLPLPLKAHSMLSINDTHSMLIGGESSQKSIQDSTYYFNHVIQEWINGPKLIETRTYFTTGIVIDEYYMDKYIIAVGGMNNKQLDTTEILWKNEWLEGIH